MAPGRHAVVVIATLAIAVAIAAAWLAPAALLDPHLARATGGALRLADAEGTVRQGRGTVIAGTSRIPITWQVGWRHLLRGAVQVQVKSGTGAATPRATITVSADTLDLHDVDVTLPADVIAATLDRTDIGFVDGAINLTADDIELTPESSRGEARLVWRTARIGMAGGVPPMDLGEVRTVLTANGNLISGPLGNEGGDIALRGDWTVQGRKSTRLALHVTPRRSGPSDLERMLSTIGTADGSGWRIEWRGTLQ